MRKYGWWRMFRILPFAVVTLVIMLLWNWLLPELFGWRSINFAQAMGILVLSKILFGTWHRPGFDHVMHRHGGWSFMTPEERTKMREKLRGRCWHGDESEHKPDSNPA